MAKPFVFIMFTQFVLYFGSYRIRGGNPVQIRHLPPVRATPRRPSAGALALVGPSGG
jgi:hypothetical protein